MNFTHSKQTNRSREIINEIEFQKQFNLILCLLFPIVIERAAFQLNDRRTSHLKLKTISQHQHLHHFLLKGTLDALTTIMYSPSPAPSEASTSFVPTASSLRRRHHPILPFHKAILREIASPAEDDLLVLAKGLGLRRIITNLLKLYDGERNLVLLINATEGDEQGLGEELSTMGVRKPGLRVVGYDYQAKQRRELYESGGLISVTSRILVVDLLTSNIPTALITGLVVLHGERVTPTSLEAFIVRLYRQVNRKGFLKAFSDEPESFSYGLSPLAGVLKTLCMRRVHLWPRFHEKVHESLGQRKADVIELYQPLTPLMSEIQSAIVECMQATLNELRRSNANVSSPTSFLL